MDKFIRNIDHESVVRLAELVSVQSGQVVSKTLAQNKAVSITLFAFDKGEEIGTHDSTGDAMVTVLEGTGRFTVGGVPHIVKAGETLVMPAKVPHAVYGEEAFKWVLTGVCADGCEGRYMMVNGIPADWRGFCYDDGRTSLLMFSIPRIQVQVQR